MDKKLLSKEWILVDYEAADLRETIEAAASLVKDRIKPGFVEAALKREEEYPTGLDLPIGVAVPHADEHFVLADGIAVITLKKPVTFGLMAGAPGETTPVSIVFLINVRDGDSHVKLLGRLFDFIQVEDHLQKIMDAKTPEGVYNLIKPLEKGE